MLMPVQETEWEELIRTGQMTPFGTRVPQRPEKKEPRKVMLSEGLGFDRYLADQAVMAISRKKPAVKKRESRHPGNDTAGDGRTAVRDRKLQKRMRKLQRNALRAHSKARPSKEWENVPTKKKGPQDSDSEGSEYVPSDELMDPDEPDRDDDFRVDEDEEYELKPYVRKAGKKARRPRKAPVNEEDYPSSSEEEEVAKKGGVKKCKDDGDIDVYKQRIR